MQIIKHAAIAEVVAVVGKPETFDLIGLTAEQMAVLFILIGNSSGDGLRENDSLFDKIRTALCVDWSDHLPNFAARIPFVDVVALLSTRKS